MRNYYKVFDCIKSLIFILFICGFAYSEEVRKPSFDGKITGRVVEKETAEPLEGVYVGTGDFGDAGGSNMTRFANQGKYRHTLTDENGQFVIDELAIMNHNLVISHIDYVRGEGYMTGTHLGTHCGVGRSRMAIESVNNMCCEVVINWTVPCKILVSPSPHGLQFCYFLLVFLIIALAPLPYEGALKLGLSFQ